MWQRTHDGLYRVCELGGGNLRTPVYTDASYCRIVEVAVVSAATHGHRSAIRGIVAVDTDDFERAAALVRAQCEAVANSQFMSERIRFGDDHGIRIVKRGPCRLAAAGQKAKAGIRLRS